MTPYRKYQYAEGPVRPPSEETIRRETQEQMNLIRQLRKELRTIAPPRPRGRYEVTKTTEPSAR